MLADTTRTPDIHGAGGRPWPGCALLAIAAGGRSIRQAAVAALLVSLLACMSDAPLQREAGSVVSEGQSDVALRTAPVTLTVSCRKGSLELGSRVVAAQSDGVRVVGDTDYAGGLLRYIDANGRTGAVSLSAGEVAAVPVPPGDARFECEPVGGGGNAVGGEIRVVDPEGHYRSFHGHARSVPPVLHRTRWEDRTAPRRRPRRMPSGLNTSRRRAMPVARPARSWFSMRRSE